MLGTFIINAAIYMYACVVIALAKSRIGLFNVIVMHVSYVF